MIDTSKTYISISKIAGREIEHLLGKADGNYRDVRNFLIPAIRESTIVAGATEKHFVALCRVKNNTIDSAFYLFCALRKGAPAESDEYTLEVYSAMNYEDGLGLLNDKIALSRFRKSAFKKQMYSAPADRIVNDNKLQSDGFLYNGNVYTWDGLGRDGLLEIKNQIDTEIKMLRLRDDYLVAKGDIEDRREKDMIRLEKSIKGILSQAIQHHLSKVPKDTTAHRVRASDVFIDVARRRLPKKTFESLLKESKLEAQEQTRNPLIDLHPPK